MVVLLIYLGVMNFIAFAMYGIDKYKAKKGLWRVPEKTLLLLAALGGSVGAYGAMQVFRHKTKHAAFYIGVPVIFILQIVAVVGLIWSGVWTVF